MRSEEEKKKMREQSLKDLKKDFAFGKKSKRKKQPKKFGRGEFGR